MALEATALSQSGSRRPTTVLAEVIVDTQDKLDALFGKHNDKGRFPRDTLARVCIEALYDGKPKKRYALAMTYFGGLLNRQGLADVTSANPQRILSLLVEPNLRKQIEASTVAELYNQQDITNPKLIESVRNLLQLTETLVIRKDAIQLAEKFAKINPGHSPAEHIKGAQVTREQSLSEDELTGFTDSFEYFLPENMPHDRVVAAQSVFEAVWKEFRQYTANKSCKVLFVYSENENFPFRSAAFMREKPEVLIELHQNDYLGVVAHEAIHAVFGAETGRPSNSDFAEGCAMRLSQEFIPNSPTNTPDMHVVQLLNQFRKTGKLGRSNTGLLDRAQQAGRQLSDYEQDTAKYVYGYFVIDALMRNTSFQALMSAEAARTGRKWAIMQKLNAAFAQIPSGIRNRDSIIPSLKSIGLTDPETRKVLYAAEQSIKKFTVGIDT